MHNSVGRFDYVMANPPFNVDDRDDSVATAESLGASVLSSLDAEWTKSAVVRDPQGAELTLSQFTPPSG